MNHRHVVALGLAVTFALPQFARAEDAVVPDAFDQQQAVTACDAYGPGFARLPGTNTCVRVSGKVSYEKRFSKSSNSGGQIQLDFETRSD